MSKQVSLTATLCAVTMALFALSTMTGGIDSHEHWSAPQLETGLSASLIQQ